LCGYPYWGGNHLPVNDDAWHHLVVLQGGGVNGKFTFFLDGVEGYYGENVGSEYDSNEDNGTLWLNCGGNQTEWDPCPGPILGGLPYYPILENGPFSGEIDSVLKILRSIM